MSGSFTVYGPAISGYVRTVCLALQEKGVPYTLKQLPMPAYREEPYLSERHPFAKVPAVEHDGFRLYETQAILRYIDDVFPGLPLQPTDLRRRARMNQVIGIVDAYFWPSATPNIILNRIMARQAEREPDAAAIAGALPRATLSVQELDRLIGDDPFFGGDRVSLADLMVLPLLDYFAQTPEGHAAVEPLTRLKAWMRRMAERESAREVLVPLAA